MNKGNKWKRNKGACKRAFVRFWTGRKGDSEASCEAFRWTEAENCNCESHDE